MWGVSHITNCFAYQCPPVAPKASLIIGFKGGIRCTLLTEYYFTLADQRTWLSLVQPFLCVGNSEKVGLYSGQRRWAPLPHELSVSIRRLKIVCLWLSKKKKNVKKDYFLHPQSHWRKDSDPDPLVRGGGIRIRTRMSRIPNTGWIVCHSPQRRSGWCSRRRCECCTTPPSCSGAPSRTRPSSGSWRAAGSASI